MMQHIHSQWYLIMSFFRMYFFLALRGFPHCRGWMLCELPKGMTITWGPELKCFFLVRDWSSVCTRKNLTLQLWLGSKILFLKMSSKKTPKQMQTLLLDGTIKEKLPNHNAYSYNFNWAGWTKGSVKRRGPVSRWVLTVVAHAAVFNTTYYKSFNDLVWRWQTATCSTLRHAQLHSQSVITRHPIHSIY